MCPILLLYVIGIISCFAEMPSAPIYQLDSEATAVMPPTKQTLPVPDQAADAGKQHDIIHREASVCIVLWLRYECNAIEDDFITTSDQNTKILLRISQYLKDQIFHIYYSNA